MFYCKLIGFNRHLVKGASQSSSLTHAYNKTQAHTALCKSYKRLKGQNLKMTKIQWTLDKRVLERPRCRQKKQTCWSCEMFCGLLPSIKIKQNKIPHRRTHFIQGCRNQLIFKAYQAGSLFSHENEIRGCTLTSHHSISGKRNPNNTASTGIANTQQSALQRGLQATRCNPRAGERKHD